MAPPGTNANPSITFDLHGHYQVELQQDPRGSRSQSRGPNTVTCVMKVGWHPENVSATSVLTLLPRTPVGGI